jgi:glycine/D-amino acid oxidase-like deaminating enzyme
MSVAYELAKRGKKVVIFDRGPIGKGMTSRTTAHLAAQCDDRFHEMIGRRGKRLATAWYDSQTASTYDSQTLSTLEQLRMLLGLSLPWLSLRTRWQSTQRPSGFTRIGGGYAVEDLARDLRKNFSPDLATKGRKNSEL